MKWILKIVLLNYIIVNSLYAQEDSLSHQKDNLLSIKNSLANIPYKPLNSLSELNSNWHVEKNFKPTYVPPDRNDFYLEIDYDPLRTHINYPVLYGISAITLGTGIAVHIYQRNAWWKDNRTSFHFQSDWPYALWSDKVGHFYAATLLVHAFSAGLEAANFQTEDAMLYGTAAALAFQYYVEIEDGFGEQWGFSPGDAIANTLGAGYALAQYYFPYLQNFQFKYSYYPSNKMRDGTHKGNIFDDYEGQRHWLAFRMKNLLPGDLGEFWPAFLNLAVGMGVKDLDGFGNGRREIFIAFDFNVLELPLTGKFGNFVKNTLNYLHLPMPGIRVSPDSAFFVFLF